MNTEPADERAARADVCGVEQTINGRVWVCVKPVHDDPPQPGHGQRSEQPTAYGYAPKSRRHYFVRKWPGTDH